MRVKVERTPRVPADKPPRDLRLPLHGAAGHLTLTRRHVLAWYRLAEIPWSFLSDEERARVVTQVARAHARLADKELHTRGTNRAYGAAEWGVNHAKALAKIGLTPPDPAAYHAATAATQRHLRHTEQATGETYLGVAVADRRLLDRAWARIHTRRSPERELRRLAEAIGGTDEIVTGPGLWGTPLNPPGLSWLTHQSVGLHLPEVLHPEFLDQPMDATDMYAFTDHVRVYPDGKHPALRIVGDAARNGEPTERWVCVLSLGRMGEQPGVGLYEPWAALAEKLGCRVEWSIHATVVPGKKAAAKMSRKLDLIADQQAQMLEHGMPHPPHMAAVEEAARLRKDRMVNASDPLLSTSVRWVARAAVPGRTAEEALANAAAFIRLYDANQIEVAHPWAQEELAREFWPGAGINTVAHTRNAEVLYYAGGIPQMSASIGDQEGLHLGETASTIRRPVMWNPYKSLFERESCGLTPVIAMNGGGKSFLGGTLAALCARIGVRGTVTDPSGTLAGLADVPWLEPITGVLDVMNARAGELSSYALIPDPRPEDAWHDKAVKKALPEEREHVAAEVHKQALAETESDRRDVASDVLRMLLEPALLKESWPGRLIDRAVKMAPALRTSSLNGVLDQLATLGEQGAELAEDFRAVAAQRSGSKFFPAGYTHAWARDKGVDDPTLLIVSMAGISLPKDGLPQEEWTREQRHSMPLLHLAQRVITARVYSRPMLEPKLAVADEIGLIGAWKSGMTMLNRWARDSRKWRFRVLVLSQDPDDILGLNVRALIEDVFIGRTNPAVAAKALELLRVTRGVGYEQIIENLPDGGPGDPREFVARLSKRTEKIRVHLPYEAELMAALTLGAVIPGKAAA